VKEGWRLKDGYRLMEGLKWSSTCLVSVEALSSSPSTAREKKMGIDAGRFVDLVSRS
jgi:hypothetical protein